MVFKNKRILYRIISAMMGLIIVIMAFSFDKIEVSADRILTYLLDKLVPAAIVYDTDEKMRPIDQRMMSFVSNNYKKIYHIYLYTLRMKD